MSKIHDIHYIGKPKEESIKSLANKQEKKISKKLSGRQTPNSGSTKFLKGDIYKEDYMIDLKSALTQKQITITEDMLRTLEVNSIRQGKQGVLLLNFPASKKLNSKTWLVIPYDNT